MNGDMERWEQKLTLAGTEERNASVPTDRLDAAIRTGLRRAKEEQGRSLRLRRRSLRVTAALAAVVAFLGLSIRLFPGFASAVSQLPGMEAIVRLIQYDRGLETAVRNDYYQPIGASQTQDGVTVRIDGAIPDEGRIVLFYTVFDSQGAAPALEIDRPRFVLPDGSELQGGYSWWRRSSGDEKSANGHSNTINVEFTNGVQVPREFSLDFKLTARGVPFGNEWSLPIRLDEIETGALRTEYAIDRTIELEGQRITFRKATVFPTRIGVELAYDEGNEKVIFSFLDISLIGDDGERYTEQSTMYVDDSTRIVFFEGSSFSIPKSLTLVGSAARAVDKDRLELIVDTRKGVVLEAPDDRIKLEQVSEKGDVRELRFRLEGVAEDDNMLYSVVEGEFADASGRTFKTGGGYVYGDAGEAGGQFVAFEIPAVAYAEPLRFRIFNYPAYIREPIEIRIR